MNDNPLEALIERIKEAENFSKDAEVARLLGMERGSLAGRKKRGSIPLEPVLEYAQHTGRSLDWLLLGRGPERQEQGNDAALMEAVERAFAAVEHEGRTVPAAKFRELVALIHAEAASPERARQMARLAANNDYPRLKLEPLRAAEEAADYGDRGWLVVQREEGPVLIRPGDEGPEDRILGLIR